jgi:actin-related protein
MYNNVVICGGTSKLKGFAERFEKELKKVAHKEIEHIKLGGDEKTRHISGWVGGSTLASHSTFKCN